MPTTPATIVQSDDIVGWNSFNSPNVDFQQDGTLWALVLDDVSTTVVGFYYSKDAGETWTRSTASDIPDVNDQGCFFIDKDDYAHWGGYDNAVAKNVYRLGTPNAEHTEWTWSDPWELTAEVVGTGVFSIVAHREGSGWAAHMVALHLDGGGGLTHMHWKMAINSSHTITGALGTAIKYWGVGTSASTVCSMDFRHTESDPKEVQSSTPNLYVVIADLGGAADPGLLYYKATYSGGSWSWSGETEITTAQQSGLANLVYDGTRVMITSMNTASLSTVRVWERDEANTTSTARDPTALGLGTIVSQQLGVGRNGDVWLVVSENTNFDYHYIRFNRTGLSWGSWAVLEADTTVVSTGPSLMRGMSPLGLGVMYVITGTTPDKTQFSMLISDHALSATFQGVATLTSALTRTRFFTSLFQGIGRWAKARLTKVPQGAPDNFVEPELDFTVFDGYLEGGDGVVHSLIYHEDGETKGTTAALPTRADKQDVGQNPLEQRAEFGDFFAQGDFSHGADQLFFHHEGRDPKKFLASEGYDITEEGSLSHLHEIAEAVDSATIGAVTQTDAVILVAQGTDVRVGNGAFPGTWGTEDPSGAEGAQTVEDLTSRGDEVFAALGTAGVHIRDSAGTWDHYQPDAAIDLDVGTATRVAWLKDRLFVAGTAGREIFEVVADSTPSAIKTLPEGWTFQSIFEAGAFVYAPAVNADAGLSRVHIFGLNNDATLIEDKGSVPIPRGELIYAGIGDPGGIFLGGGKANDDGGYDPVFYQAIQSENGFLQLLKIAQGVGGNTDCSVLAFETLGDTIVFSWSQGSAALTGERAGIAMYNLGRQAFSQHLKKDAVSSAQVQDILFYEGRLILSIKADGLYYEDTSTFVADAFLISSIADWGGASLKVWDRAEVSHGALAADTTVTVQYTTEDPSEEEWFSTIISETDGDTGASSKLSNIVSRLFAVKLSSTANAAGTAAPTIQSFAIRSNLTRAQPEFTMTRFVRILAKDRKDGKGSVVYKDPVAERLALMLLLDSWVTVWEPGIIWNAFIKSVSDTEPAEPFLNATNGEPLKEAYLVRLDMVATGEAA